MVQGLLLPLAAACLAVVASALASRLARWLADMAALSRLPHPPATCFWRGVCAAGDLAFHRSLTRFAAQYGGIYSIRFYHLKARGPAWRTGLPLSWPCLAAAKLPLSWLCFAALLCSSHRAALAARLSTEASRYGLSSERGKAGPQVVVVSDPLLVHELLARGSNLDKAADAYNGIDMVRTAPRDAALRPRPLRADRNE